jgi:glycosyltransferase involved in cell wall biosynthesis
LALFVFPSLYEGFGLPLLEAMACGVPVLSSDSSCLPEVAGEAAILISPDNQEDWTRVMLETLADPSRRMKMVAAGFLQAREFTWPEAARQLLSIYQNLLL